MASQTATKVTYTALDRLPPFPPVACRLLQQLASEETDFRSVSELISSDAALAGQVLRLANSALISFRHEIRSIFQATAVIGVDRLRALVATIALKTYAAATAAGWRYWRHNLACALLSEAFGEYFSFEGPVAYTAGLLHDIGRIAMSALLGEKYDELAFDGDKERVGLAAERAAFDADHCLAGGHLAQSWSFPEDLRFCIARHHDAMDGDYAALIKQKRMVRLLQTAEKAEALLGFYPSEVTSVDVLEMVPLGRAECESRLPNLVEAVLIKINATECCLN